ncbi:MAG: murein hydrolase activator EnvC family protein [Chitinophagaceae bacterium]
MVAQSNEKETLEKRKQETLREIDALNRQFDDLKKNKKQSLGQLALIQNKIKLRNRLINDINNQVRIIDGNINDSYREIRRLQRDLDTLRMQYAQNVVYAYKNRSNYDFLNFIFSASSFNDALRRVNYLKAYRNYRTQQMEVINRTEILYKQKIEELSTSRKEKQVVLQDQTKEMSKLVDDKKEQDVVVNNLKKREKEINNMLSAKRKQATALEASIKAVVRREIEAAKKEAERKAKEEKDRLAKENAKPAAAEPAKSSTATTAAAAAPAKPATTVKKTVSYLEYNKEDLALGTNFEANRGRLPFPVDNGYVAIAFGPYTVPGTNLKGNQDFITIASPEGTVVKAVFDGEVASVFDVGGMSAVTIRHGKYFTTYSNLASVNVKKNEQIKTGQTIGRVGTNLEGEGQIDFILTRETQMLNPTSWLRSR